jgi:tetratricopeptide (TPR) repeat protein
MFNPLEIGAMVESEDIDWEPSAAGAGSAASPQASPSPARSLPSLDDTGGLSWLDEAEKNRPGKLAEAGGGEARSVFDEEDDFFDLAAELEQELSQEDLFPGGDSVGAAPAEQSLEEIVEGFKKGVAEHLSPTDYDTHFNLGIAYREMGLLDEAIGEFQIAAKDDGHLVLCCSMLGLCFLDKGLPDVAITWYERGLEAPGLGDEDHLGLLYDLGCSYLALEDRISAFQTFVDLSGLNPNYRDVAARIEQLGN